MVAKKPRRRFIRYRHILAIDTGGPTGSLSDFDVSRMREEHLDEKAGLIRGEPPDEGTSDDEPGSVEVTTDDAQSRAD